VHRPVPAKRPHSPYHITDIIRTAYRGDHKLKTLILTPTRELAIQIDESFSAYGKNLKLRHTAIFGGVPQGTQVRLLREA